MESGFVYLYTDKKTGELHKKVEANWNEFEKKVCDEHHELS